jgi:hypothetical protein
LGSGQHLLFQKCATTFFHFLLLVFSVLRGTFLITGFNSEFLGCKVYGEESLN